MTTAPIPIRQSPMRFLPGGLAGLFKGGALALAALLGTWFIYRDAPKYLDFTPETYQRFWDVRFSLALHALSATFALFVAPLQFVDALRRRAPRVHRMIGWVYITGSLVSMPLVLRLALASGCAMCRPAFVTWTVVWSVVTVLALIAILRRRIEAHRQFMIRSYVLMLAFVFIRMDTHIPFPLPIDPGVERSSMVIWVSWIVPWMVLEIWLGWLPQLKRPRKPARARASALEAEPDIDVA